MAGKGERVRWERVGKWADGEGCGGEESHEHNKIQLAEDSAHALKHGAESACSPPNQTCFSGTISVLTVFVDTRVYSSFVLHTFLSSCHHTQS